MCPPQRIAGQRDGRQVQGLYITAYMLDEPLHVGLVVRQVVDGQHGHEHAVALRGQGPYRSRPVCDLTQQSMQQDHRRQVRRRAFVEIPVAVRFVDRVGQVLLRSGL